MILPESLTNNIEVLEDLLKINDELLYNMSKTPLFISTQIIIQK